MSDFLTRLVARTLDAAPTLRPRVASRHEPAAPGGPAEIVEVVELPAPRSSPPDAAARPHWPVAASQEGRPAPARVEPPVVAPAPPPAAAKASPAARLPAAPSPPPAPAPARRRTQAGEQPASSPVRDEAAPLPPDSRLPGRSSAVEAAPPSTRPQEPARPPDLAPGPPAQAAQRDPAVPAPARVPRSAVEHRAEERHLVPREEVKPPPAFLPAERSQVRRVETPPSAYAPTIEVTIGRIEVRAVTPPAAPPPAAAPRPAIMPLDEYLRERSRGTR